MNGRIGHRGPDDAGFFYSGTVALGHRRLSILDLSPAGHQPMTWNGRYTITFNGEIYNYLELRDELGALGYRFQSQSDTEVILAAFDHWGAACTSRFNGMWAFVIHDATAGTLFASRDRFGVKPLIYAQVGDLFVIASEAKQIAALEGFVPRMDELAAARFLAFSKLNVDSRTAFEGITELRGGHELTYDLSSRRLTIRRWYDIRDATSVRTFDFAQAQVEFRRVFFDAVKLRMRSDVEVGACLSGGVDSSSIVVAAKATAGADSRVRTVTCGWDDVRCDETHFARAVTDATGFPSVDVRPSISDLLDDGVLDRMIWHQDQPVPSTSHFAEYKVYEASRAAGLIVMLAGAGADETLAGYPEFFSAFARGQVRRGRVRRGVKEALARDALRGLPPGHTIRAIARSYLITGLHEAAALVRPARPAVRWMKNTAALRSAAEELAPPAHSIRELTWQQLLHSSIPYQLHSDDRSSMAHSVESRLPFLDYRVVELVCGLPDEFKIRDGETKAVLRHSVADLLPSVVRNRHLKLGFPAPEETWIRANAPALRRDLEDLVGAGGLANEVTLSNFDDWVAGTRAYDPSYFRAITMMRWIRAFNVRV